MSQTKPVIIIGGGITGLAAAWELQQRGIEYIVLEASNRLGGKIKTERTAGFIIEAGVDSFLTTKPEGYRLCREIGLADSLVTTNQTKRNVYVLRGGRLHLMPPGMRLLVPTDPAGLQASSLFSEAAKTQMLAEAALAPAPAESDESLASFVRRRFGDEALTVLGEPLLAGIYTGNPETLSMEAVYPSYMAFEREYGSVTRGTLATATAAPAADKPPAMFVSLRNGMLELIEQLQKVLTGQIRLNTPVERLSKDGLVRLANGEIIEAAGVILTIPAASGAKLLAEFAPELATQLGSIKTVSSATVSFGFKASDLNLEFDGYGFVVAADEPTHLVAGTWNSVKLPERAPAGHVLLRVFLGGHRHQEDLQLSDPELINLARAEIKNIQGITAEPVISRVFRWVAANPQYEVGHRSRLVQFRANCPDWLQLAGAPYEGVGIPDCIRQGRAAAQRIVT